MTIEDKDLDGYLDALVFSYSSNHVLHLLIRIQKWEFFRNFSNIKLSTVMVMRPSKLQEVLIHQYRYLFVKIKVFNYSEMHFSEGTSFKIHTLEDSQQAAQKWPFFDKFRILSSTISDKQKDSGFSNFWHRARQILKPAMQFFVIPKRSFLKRSIFQTFWKLHCCAKFLFIELETSNIGYLLIFLFPLTVQSFSKIGQH